MNAAARRDAGTWLAFSAGMFAESAAHSAKFIDEQYSEDEARDEFLITCGDACTALAVDHEDALKCFDNGRKFMVELRATTQTPPPAVPEDGLPCGYTGPERQLAAKPNGRLC